MDQIIMMNNCDFWFKLYAKQSFAQKIISFNKARLYFLSESPPPLNVINANIINKLQYDYVEKWKKYYISGPCCGSRILNQDGSLGIEL